MHIFTKQLSAPRPVAQLSRFDTPFDSPLDDSYIFSQCRPGEPRPDRIGTFRRSVLLIFSPSDANRIGQRRSKQPRDLRVPKKSGVGKDYNLSEYIERMLD